MSFPINGAKALHTPPPGGAARALEHGKAVATELPAVARQVIASVPAFLQGGDRVRCLSDGVRRLDERGRLSLIRHVEGWMQYMLEIGASDMDAGGPSANGHVWYRVDGEKQPHPLVGHYAEDETSLLFLSMLGEPQVETLLSNGAVDFSRQLDLPPVHERRRFRATCYLESDHLALNMRAISSEIRPLSSLGFHPLVERGLLFRHERDGLTLVTGVTGSGKSSTLDAIIDENNRDSSAHIIIIGQPIEYVHPSQKSIVRHREVGRDVRSFKDGIVQALRQDPDIVVIGEMRDPVTISSALEITDSGHKVFSTLHTSSAVESIDRIIAEYPANEQERVRYRLADTLRCIVSQKLLPKAGGGRVLAKEVLWMTSSSRAAIKNNNTGEIYQMMWEGGAMGQMTLEQDLARLLRQRLITLDTAMNYANNKRRLQQIIS